MKASEMNQGQLVSWFLIASYAYYELGEPVMSDEEFDKLVERLTEEYDDIDHPHKHLITEDHLKATTGYDINFPTIVKDVARTIIHESR